MVTWFLKELTTRIYSQPRVIENIDNAIRLNISINSDKILEFLVFHRL